MANLVSDRTAAKLKHLLNRHDLDAPGRRGGGTARWAIVRCLEATAVGGNDVLDQCYPAIILQPASDYPAPPERAALCLLTLLGPGGEAVTPTVDQPYPALLTGEVVTDPQASGSGSGGIESGGRLRAFAAAPDLAAQCPTYSQTNRTELYNLTVDDEWTSPPSGAAGDGFRVTLPRAGQYLLFGKMHFQGGTDDVIHSSQQHLHMATRIWNATAGEAVESTEMIASFDGDNRLKYESRSFTAFVTAYEDDTVMEYQFIRSSDQTGVTTVGWLLCQFGTAVITEFGFNARPNLGYKLLCAIPSEGSGSGSGSGGCDPIPRWAGAGWYCVFSDGGSVPAELLEGDECDESIIILSGPYVDEAAAIAGCEGDGSGDPPGTLGYCPDYEPSPGVGATTGAMTRQSFTGDCSEWSESFPVTISEGPDGGALLETAGSIHSGMWQLWAVLREDGEAIFVIWKNGGVGSIPGVIVDMQCDETGIAIDVDFTFAGDPCAGTVRYRFNLT